MKIAIIGTGNVADQLVIRFQETSVSLFGVMGSSPEKTRSFSERHQLTAITNQESLYDSDLIILCVQDSKLAELIPLFSKYSKVATTSGTFDITTCPASEHPIGVFYPLQSFTSGTTVDFSNIPIFVESADLDFSLSLKSLACEVGKTGIEMPASERIHLHIGAVFINNFTHHLNGLAREYGNEHHIDFSWYEALIDETFRKIKLGAKDEDQTGPAKRNDTSSVNKHIELLDGQKKIIYQCISESIQQKFKKHD